MPVSGSRVALAGATGEIGGRVARLLAARGVPQRLIVRDAARAPQLPGADVVEVPGGYDDGEAMTRALEGAAAFLLIPGHEGTPRVAAHRTAVHAAAQAHVGRIVQLSFAGAAEDSTFTFARDHWATEQDVRAAGVPFVIAQMNFYLDVLPGFVLPSGEIAGPGGNGKIAAVARDDVAAALAELLIGDGHTGQTYELTGPEALSLAEIAVTMARASGRTITYLQETIEQAWAARAAYDAPDDVKAGWISTYTAVAAGELARVSGDVERLTGAPPQSLAGWLEAHPLALAHVDTLG